MPPSIEQGTTWLVTADHGNCDEMLAPDGAVLTQHSLNKVPFVVAGKAFAGKLDALTGDNPGLADIAPTVLQLLGIKQPEAMTGRALIKSENLP